MAFNRRKLLKWLPPSLAAALVPGWVKGAPSPAPAPASAPDDEYDVAVVGGGVAGCYVAYRLLHGTRTADSPLGSGPLKVGLFEYSGRVGGRLLAAEIPRQGNPNQRVGDDSQLHYAEFGGFRFQEQMHIVRDLAQLLKLEHQPFPVDEPQNNPIFLRNTRFLRSQLNPVSVPIPYNLKDFELAIVKGEIPGNGDLTTFVANQAFTTSFDAFLVRLTGKCPTPTPATTSTFSDGPSTFYTGYTNLRTCYHTAFQAADWETVTLIRKEYEKVKQEVSVDGRPLTDWGWWALMSNFLSDEAIAFIEDIGGYNSLYSTGNVSTNLREDFYFADETDVFGPNGSPSPCTETVWQHVTTGYSDIPERLYEGFHEAGGTGHLNHQLLGFEKLAGGGYQLRFFLRESGTLTYGEGEQQCSIDPAACKTVNARFLILAMPKRSLELLDGTTFFLRNPTVRQLLDTVLNVPAQRLFMAYPSPWWLQAEESDPPTCGRSTTDLRVRQFYYWLTAKPDQANQESFMLASYVNGQAEKYWRSLHPGPALDSLPGSVHQKGRSDGAQGRGPRAASKTMARLAHEQLKTVVGVPDAPEPYYAHFQDWTKDPWGAGWHAWTAGNNDDTLIPQILQPLPEERIYVCGECWSNVQGWVQGALNTSEVMLQERLGYEYPLRDPASGMPPTPNAWLTQGGTWLGPGSNAPTV